MQNKGSELPKEHILVCLSSSPSNERIVRMAGKMAQAFSGSLTALYVQTPGDADMNAEDTVRLQANMRLAQQLAQRSSQRMVKMWQHRSRNMCVSLM